MGAIIVFSKLLVCLTDVTIICFQGSVCTYLEFVKTVPLVLVWEASYVSLGLPNCVINEVFLVVCLGVSASMDLIV